MKINLLPRKEFELILDSGTIQGKYGLWSYKRYCDIKQISLSEMLSALDKEDSLDDLCLILLCSVEYSSRKKGLPFNYTDVDICEWIEEMGGVTSDNFLKLLAHAKGEEETKEKKTAKVEKVKTSNGKIIKSSVIPQE